MNIFNTLKTFQVAQLVFLDLKKGYAIFGTKWIEDNRKTGFIELIRDLILNSDQNCFLDKFKLPFSYFRNTIFSKDLIELTIFIWTAILRILLFFI